jgi:hypothetical protein
MVKFGSEPWFEPKRNRTERQIGVKVRPLDPDRTDGSVRGLFFSENASECGLNPNPSKVFRILFDKNRDAVVRSEMRSGPGPHRTEPRVWFGSGSRSGLFPFFHQGPVQGSCKAGYVVDPV